MPRKTSGMPFEVHRSPMSDEDGHVLLYAAPQSNRTKDFDEIEGWLRPVTVRGTSAGQKVYSLDGRLLRTNGSTHNLAKGIYIVNGHKVVIK